MTNHVDPRHVPVRDEILRIYAAENNGLTCPWSGRHGKALMMDGEWRTLDEIASTVGHCSTPSASARLRDIRKARFGAFNVERKRIGKGLFAYRVTKPLPSRQVELFQ